MKRLISFIATIVAVSALGQVGRYESIPFGGVIARSNTSYSYTNTVPFTGRIVAWNIRSSLNTTASVDTVANKGMSGSSRNISPLAALSASSTSYGVIASNVYAAGDLVKVTIPNTNKNVELRFDGGILVEK